MQSEKLSKGLTGIAGEYFVAAELSIRGFMASVTLRNNDSIDIHTSNPDGSKIFAIQVKTNQNQTKSWPVGIKAETRFRDNLFYVFVSLKSLNERPDYFIVPSKTVAERVSQGHKKWLATPGKNGSVHQNTTMRNFSDPFDEFLEKWEVLK